MFSNAAWPTRPNRAWSTLKVTCEQAARRVREQRTTLGERRGAHLMRGRGGVEAAADEEVTALSRRFNIRMAELVDDPRERTWLKLYRRPATTWYEQ